MKTFKLKVITPNAIVLDTNVEQIIARSIDGEIGILPDHTPLITPLSIAPFQYWEAGDRKVAAVLGGMMEVSKEGVTIISDHAALAENIDTVVADKEKELAEAKLAQKKDKIDIQKAEMELTRLLVMLEAVELAKRLKSTRVG
ncbi:MAG: ATP synthase F1 subunit epsilon [Candidatus Melainabacteria bacterium RIFCSPLOWO2_02_FULL_35_15]|nr:MAG: ATP synthase F1 subunit epsilon [Candidatus Melainabacteria bacterium RIFCSPLOWO2_12_FULL_35_11]OGI13179.1 MAG: ATP synthase F1 subunit epsilon [Candidatus Melainabacteria bacterium RIFCSPLOWO2_02_FULL_35_15]